MKRSVSVTIVSGLAVSAFQVVALAQSHAASAIPSPTVRAGSASAATLLGRITTAVESNSGYKRSKFKQWTKIDKCDTRARVLTQESLRPVTKTSSCRVVSGLWFSAYDGRTFTNAPSLDIDHMIPLAEAWGSGAKKWTAKKRERFANDTAFGGSLIAVSASSNRSKGDRDPAEWSPPSGGFRCTYAKTWIAVKYRWRLSADAREKAALRTMLSSCGNLSVGVPSRAN